MWKNLTGVIYDEVCFKGPINICANFITKEELTKKVQDLIDKNLPQLSGGTFGIFKGRNNTSENNMYRVDDGENDLHLYLSVIEFNGKTSLPENWWPDIAPTPKGQNLGIKGNEG